MKPRTFLLLAALATAVQAGRLAADDLEECDWKAIKSQPATVEVSNMEPVPLAVSQDKGGWAAVPGNLTGMSVYTAVKDLSTGGVADITVTGEGYLVVACNYDLGGSSAGGWKQEITSAQKLREQGWQQLTKNQLGGPLTGVGDRQFVVFLKLVHKGEDYRLRCSKYAPPAVMVAGTGTAVAAAPSAESVAPDDALSCDWPTIQSQPATITVENMEPGPLVVSPDKDGWAKVPANLTGANVYALAKSVDYKTAAAKSTGAMANITVTGDGYLLVACNYDYEGNASGGWQGQVWSAAKFKAQGWQQLSKAQMGGALVSGDNKQYTVFLKEVRTGEKFALRCNKYLTPFPIVPGGAKAAASTHS